MGQIVKNTKFRINGILILWILMKYACKITIIVPNDN